MSNSLLKELKAKIEEIEGWEIMDVDEVVEELRKHPRYSKTSPSVLKTNINKLGILKEEQGKTPADEQALLKRREAPSEVKDKTQDAGGMGAKVFKFDNVPKVFFSDLGGYQNAKKQASDFITINVKNRNLYHSIGINRCPKHILINGPAGSGKSTFAAAICNEAGLNFIRLTLYDPRIYSTLSDGKMNQFLKLVKENQPAALIIDDLDYFFTGEGGAKESERKALQNLFDFFDSILDSEVYLIGIVTRMEKLNQALLRSNRFEVRIDLKIPDESEREEILRRLLVGKTHNVSEYKDLSFMTAGYVTADLERLVIKAGEMAIQEYLQVQSAQNGAKSESKQPVITLSEEHFHKALKLITPIIKHEGFTMVPSTKWEDIGALQDLKISLDKLIIKPIMNPETCDKFGIKRQAGILLYGPPGCGKTLLAKAVANACRANFIYVKGPELLSKYVGESEKAVRGLFERAKLTAPCLIFFDEIDGLCPKRGNDGNQAIERVVNQLLTEMNGIDDMNQIYLIGATNRPDIIDKAVLRPERLGVHLYVPLPSHEDRIDILKTLLKKKPVEPNLDIYHLIGEFDFHNFSGADLNAFVEASARAAAWGAQGKQVIDETDFRKGYQESKPSITNEEVRYYEKLKSEFR